MLSFGLEPFWFRPLGFGLRDIRSISGPFRAVDRPYNGRLRRGPALSVCLGQHGKPENRAKRGPVNPRTGDFVPPAACILAFRVWSAGCALGRIATFQLGPLERSVQAAEQNRVSASPKKLAAGFLGGLAAQDVDMTQAYGSQLMVLAWNCEVRRREASGG